MFRRLICLAVVAAVLVPASAFANHKPSQYCKDEPNSFCTSAKKVDGVRRFWIATFQHQGSYTLCVKAPDHSTKCRHFTLSDDDGDGIYTDSVVWLLKYHDKGAGKYSVWWQQDGARIGPILGFHAH